MNLKLHPEKLYDLSVNGYCGLLMPRELMKKAVKILHKNSQELKELFTANKDKIRPSDWSMSELPDPVYVKFFVDKDWQEKVDQRISLFKLNQPEPITECYVVEDYFDGKKIANLLKQQKLIDNPLSEQ